MNTAAFKFKPHTLCLPLAGALLACASVGAQEIATPPPLAIKPFSAAPMLLVAEEPGWTADQTPADFLEGVGRRMKARWRQLYREAPPHPRPCARRVPSRSAR